MFDGTSLDNNAALGTEPLAGLPAAAGRTWFYILMAGGGYLIQQSLRQGGPRSGLC